MPGLHVHSAFLLPLTSFSRFPDGEHYLITGDLDE